MAATPLPEEYKIIGSRIRECRLARNMSQAQLAEKARVSLPHISAIENGKSTLLLPTFIHIIEALQISADALLRTDIPEVNTIYQTEFSELLSDCTPKELDAILSIVKEVKRSMRSVNNDNMD